MFKLDDVQSCYFAKSKLLVFLPFLLQSPSSFLLS